MTGHVLRHHLGMDKHLNGQDGEWRLGAPPMSRDRNVVMFGFGALGRSCGEALLNLDFKVSGWSNSPKEHDKITTYHGKDGFSEALSIAEIAVLLLPATPDTENMFNAAAFSKMPKDAVIINPGRGNLINDSDLIDALDKNHLGHATLDVFRVEPLPKEDPFWSHPKVTVRRTSRPKPAHQAPPRSLPKIFDVAKRANHFCTKLTCPKATKRQYLAQIWGCLWIRPWNFLNVFSRRCRLGQIKS